MLSEILRNSANFVFLILIQVLLLNNMHYSVYINPSFYILFLIYLPFEIPKPLLLLIGLLTGLTIDAFMDSLGIHAAACVFLAYVRPNILRLIAPRDGYEFGQRPRTKYMGWAWFLTYVTIIVFFHHLFLFFVDAFSFHNFFLTLFKAILSSIITLVLIIITELLLTK